MIKVLPMDASTESIQYWRSMGYTIQFVQTK
jgi:hypothetical protein